MSFHEEEVLGKAYDARLMRRLLGYLRPHKAYVAGALLALVGDAAFQLAPPYLVKMAIDRLHRAGRSRRAERHCASSTSAASFGVVLARVRADLPDADDRPAHHVRHAHADLPASAAARPVVLRQEPGRPADDPRHHRRRRHQRSVHVRGGGGVRRPVHARRHHDHALLDGLAAGADHVFGAAADPGAGAVVPDATSASRTGRCARGSRASTRS